MARLCKIVVVVVAEFCVGRVTSWALECLIINVWIYGRSVLLFVLGHNLIICRAHATDTSTRFLLHHHLTNLHTWYFLLTLIWTDCTQQCFFTFGVQWVPVLQGLACVGCGNIMRTDWWDHPKLFMLLGQEKNQWEEMYFRNGKERMFGWSLLSLSRTIATNNMNMLLSIDACMHKTLFLSEKRSTLTIKGPEKASDWEDAYGCTDAGQQRKEKHK